MGGEGGCGTSQAALEKYKSNYTIAIRIIHHDYKKVSCKNSFEDHIYKLNSVGKNIYK